MNNFLNGGKQEVESFLAHKGRKPFNFEYILMNSKLFVTNQEKK